MSRHHSKRGTSDRVDFGRPKPKFIGFAEGDTDLYEFHTSSGEYVYVHDMECIGIDFRPLTRQLLLTLENSSSDLMARLALVLTFEGAEVYQWEIRGEGDATGTEQARDRGQVSDLSMIGPASFSISLLELAVSFHATSVTCEVTLLDR